MKRLINFFLSLGFVLSFCWQIAWAQSGYEFSVDGKKLQSLNNQAYMSDGEIMVPMEELSERLGGLAEHLKSTYVYDFETEFGLDMMDYMDSSIAILNDRVLVIIPKERVCMNVPVDQIYALHDADYNIMFDRLTEEILNGSISFSLVEFPMKVTDDCVFLPLSDFASLFDLKYVVHEQTIDFSNTFKTFKISPQWEPDDEDKINIPKKKNVTFQLELSSKTYDGQPIPFSSKDMVVLCDGKIVTDYQEPVFIYAGLEGEAILLNPDEDSLSPKAGAYVLEVRTSPNDPKYEGTERFPFQILPAPITLRARDKTITAGMKPDKLEYDINGLQRGESPSQVMVSEPDLTIGNANIAIPGDYTIQISGGATDCNHRIVQYESGTLKVVMDSRKGYVKIQCIDHNGKILLENEKSDLVGKVLEITAPEVAGYSVVGASIQQAVIGQTEKVTFTYRASEKNDSSYTGKPKDMSSSSNANRSDISDTLDISHRLHTAYLSGYPDGSFRPRNRITRKECASMLYALVKQQGILLRGSKQHFLDVLQEHWYAEAVNTLADLDIVSGYPDRTYRPDNYVSRVEFTVMAVRLANLPAENRECRFYDIPDTYWAAGYIQAAAEAGLVVGNTDGTFAPMRAITRAEAVTILNQAGGHADCRIDSARKVFHDVPSNDWAYHQIMIAANDHPG